MPPLPTKIPQEPKFQINYKKKKKNQTTQSLPTRHHCPLPTKIPPEPKTQIRKNKTQQIPTKNLANPLKKPNNPVTTTMPTMPPLPTETKNPKKKNKNKNKTHQIPSKPIVKTTKQPTTHHANPTNQSKSNLNHIRIQNPTHPNPNDKNP